MWGYSHQCARPGCTKRVAIPRHYHHFLEECQRLFAEGNHIVNSSLLRALTDTEILIKMPTTDDEIVSHRISELNLPHVEYWADASNVHLDTFCSKTCLFHREITRNPRGSYISLRLINFHSKALVDVLISAKRLADTLRPPRSPDTETTPLLRSQPPVPADATQTLLLPETHENSFRECWTDTHCLAIFTRTHQLPTYTIIFALLAVLGLITLLLLQRYYEIFGSATSCPPVPPPATTLPPPTVLPLVPFNTTLPPGFELQLPGHDCQATAALADYLSNFLTAWQFPHMSVSDMINAVARNFAPNMTSFVTDWNQLTKCRWGGELEYLMNLPTPSVVTLQRIIELLRKLRR